MPKHWQLVKIATTAVFAGIRDTDKMENEFVNDFVREIFLLVAGKEPSHLMSRILSACLV